MNNPPLPDWIARSNGKAQSRKILRIYVLLMKELHLSYEDIMEMPIPAIFSTFDELNEMTKEHNKEMKRNNRR